MKIDHPESARLYCLFALGAFFVPARLVPSLMQVGRSFRMQPILSFTAASRNFRNPQFSGAVRPHGREKL
jgi:hypothetical protein